MVLLSNQIETSFSAWCPEYFWGKTSKVPTLIFEPILGYGFIYMYMYMYIYIHIDIYIYYIIYHISYIFFYPYFCLRFDIRTFGTCWQNPKASTSDSSHRGVACKTTFTWWHSSYVREPGPVEFPSPDLGKLWFSKMFSLKLTFCPLKKAFP